MPEQPPFLAVPLVALCDRDGRLLSADAGLLRLHEDNGGVAGGLLAVPQLFDLTQLAAKTRLRFERLVRVADATHDLDLWVEAQPIETGVRLSVLGWQEHIWASGAHYRPTRTPARPGAMADPALWVAPGGLIVRSAPLATQLLGRPVQGRHIDQILRSPDGADGWEGVFDRGEALGPLPVETITGLGLLLSATPVAADDGSLQGFQLRLAPAADNAGAPHAAAEKSSEVGFGRHFASAVRQPLTRIMANAETIGARLSGPIEDNYAGYAQDIATAARHLSDLVGDLEDLEAIDRPDFSVAREEVELGDIAKRVAGLLALKAADHQIELVLPEQTGDVRVIGEFRRILQIVLNLVGNAIRYAPDGSRVTIAVDAAQSALSVGDEGQGIPAENRERVFEKFERLGRSGDGGSGLGLYISRLLARAMDGELAVGEAPGGGALFTLRLPAAG